MANNHINGEDPYRMSPSEASREVKSWVENGGTVRHDEKNKHSSEEHYHIIDGNPNEDLLIIVDPSLEQNDESDNSEETADSDSEENDDD